MKVPTNQSYSQYSTREKNQQQYILTHWTTNFVHLPAEFCNNV